MEPQRSSRRWWQARRLWRSAELKGIAWQGQAMWFEVDGGKRRAAITIACRQHDSRGGVQCGPPSADYFPPCDNSGHARQFE